MKNLISKFQKLKRELFKLRQIDLIYRGDNLNNLYKRFGIVNVQSEDSKNELLKRVFLIGDKSRYFYKDEILKVNGYDRNIKLTDSDNEIIDGIFLQMNSATKSKKDYLRNYFENNRQLKSYFENLNNRSKFIEGINLAKDKFRYRNYYLTILHQLYFDEYRNNTHFVSTSTKFDLAKSFAKNKGVIIHCWQPVAKFKRLLLKKYNLPRQKISAFGEQYEVSLIGGILPHFIIGVEFLTENEFYFNSNIFENDISLEVFMFGLNINQENFYKVIKKTRFRSSFTVAGKKIYEKNADQ